MLLIGTEMERKDMFFFKNLSFLLLFISYFLFSTLLIVLMCSFDILSFQDVLESVSQVLCSQGQVFLSSTMSNLIFEQSVI